MSKLIKTEALEKGHRIILPMGGTATVAEEPKVGRTYVTYRTEYGTARVRIGDEVQVQQQLTEEVQTGEDTYEERPMFRPCYECGGFDGVTAPARAVVGTFTTNKRQDPTQAYELECGHSTIDC